MIDDQEPGGPAKAIGALLMLVVLCVTLFGCGASSSPAPAPTTRNESQCKYNKGDVVYLVVSNQKVQVIRTYFCGGVNPEYSVRITTLLQGMIVFKEVTLNQFELKATNE